MKIELLLKNPLNNGKQIDLILGQSDEAQTHKVVGSGLLHVFSTIAHCEMDYGIDKNAVSYELISKYLPPIHINALTSLMWGDDNVIDHDYELLWNDLVSISLDAIPIWKDIEPFKNDNSVLWGFDENINLDGQSLWDDIAQFKNNYTVHWDFDENKAIDRVLTWSDQHNNYSDAVIPFNNAQSIDKSPSIIVWGKGAYNDLNFESVWDEASSLKCGKSERYPTGNSHSKDDNWDVIRDLILSCEANNRNPIDLILGKICNKKDKTSIPRQKAYIIVNNVDIFRTKDGIKLNVFAVDIAIDEDSFKWTATLAMHFQNLESVSDYPEIEINLNHLKWIMKIDSVDTTEAFNRRRITVSCSSVTDILSDISATEIDHESTAHQIAYNQLMSVGLDSTFTLDYQAQDWGVPNQMLSYANQTPIDIIAQLMSASDDVMLSHYHKREILTRERYKENYWALTTPIFLIPDDIIVNRQRSERQALSYDNVIVSGEDSGISALVRRFGYSDSYPAEMVVDKLITDERVARQRGRNIINRSGVKQDVVVSVPLHSNLPYLYPRDIIAIEDENGFIRSLNFSAAISNRARVIRSNITIEKHLRDEFV